MFISWFALRTLYGPTPAYAGVTKETPCRHPDEGRDPLHSTKTKEIRTHWIPACVGMTVFLCFFLSYWRKRIASVILKILALEFEKRIIKSL